MLNKNIDQILESDLKNLEVDDFSTLIWETSQKAVILYKAQGWPLRHDFLKSFDDIEKLLRGHLEYAIGQLKKGAKDVQIESGMIMLQASLPKDNYAQFNFFFSL